jgi:hypothetical protein
MSGNSVSVTYALAFVSIFIFDTFLGICGLMGWGLYLHAGECTYVSRSSFQLIREGFRCYKSSFGSGCEFG